MSCGTSLSNVHIKEEPQYEEPDDAAPPTLAERGHQRIKHELESQGGCTQLVKDESDCKEDVDAMSWTQVEIKCERDDIRVKLEPCSQGVSQLVKKEPPQDLNQMYEGHIIKEELTIGPEVWQQPALRMPKDESNEAPSKDKKAIKTKNITYKHACKTCNKKFKRKFDLLRHHRTHTGERPFKCDVCDKEFKDRSHIIAHVRIHSGVKPHICHICNKKFIEKGRVTKHLLIHSRDKLYICHYCDKKYYWRCNLIDHLHVHTGEKRYSCKICNKNFTQKGTLTTHLYLHSGEKPFPCVMCGKRFPVKGYLTNHIRNAHRGIVAK